MNAVQTTEKENIAGTYLNIFYHNSSDVVNINVYIVQ